MKSITVGFFTRVKSLDPALVQDYVSQQIIQQLHETPYRRSSDGSIHPVIFTDRLVRGRGPGGRTTLTGTVRDDLVFSDGSPVTPEHVVESLARAQPVVANAGAVVQGADVVFTLDRDDPRFEVALSHRWSAVVKRVGDRILGLGPFVVRDGWTPERIVIERNERATRVPKLDRVVFEVFTGDTRVRDLKTAIAEGTVDLTTSLGRSEIGDLRDVRKNFQPASSTAFISMNMDHPALAQVEVRRAIAEAIDRRAVAELQYENPHAFVARSLLPPSMWRESDGVRHDPTRARDRLAGSGVHPNRPLRLMTMWGPRPYLPFPLRTAQLVSRQLEAIGLQVEIVETRDHLDYMARQSKGLYDLTVSGWIADTPDRYDFLAALLHSDSVPSEDGASVSYASNTSRYRSEEFDRRLDAFRESGSDEELVKVMDLIRDDAPIFPLFYGPNIMVHRWHVRNTELGIMGVPEFADVDID